MNEAIKISELTKKYGTQTVLKGLDFWLSAFLNLPENSIINYQPGKSGGSIWRLP